MIELPERYRTRPIRFVELWENEGWRIKVYSAAYDRPGARGTLINAIKERAGSVLPQPAFGEGSYGVGFLCAHDGNGGCFAFVDWWADENELHHHIFTSPEHEPHKLEKVGADGLTACVWDLALMNFERNAWVDCVLANTAGPDIDGYLSRRLDTEI